MNRLMYMLKNQMDQKRVQTKVQRFDSSKGIAMLGDRPFVSQSYCSQSLLEDSQDFVVNCSNSRIQHHLVYCSAVIFNFVGHTDIATSKHVGLMCDMALQPLH